MPEAQPESNGDKGHGADRADDSSNYDTCTWTVVIVVSVVPIVVVVAVDASRTSALGGG